MIILKADDMTGARINAALRQGYGVEFCWWGPPGSLPRYLSKLMHDVLVHVDFEVWSDDGVVEVMIFPADERIH